MANGRSGVQIETRRKHELSIPFQSDTADQSLNVGALLAVLDFSILCGYSLSRFDDLDVEVLHDLR